MGHREIPMKNYSYFPYKYTQYFPSHRVCTERIFFTLLFFLRLITYGMASKFEQEHNECRGRVCVLCYHKGDRPISEREIKCIDQYLIEGYTSDNPEFPNALCTGCTSIYWKKLPTANINSVLKFKIMMLGELSTYDQWPHAALAKFVLLQKWQA